MEQGVAVNRRTADSRTRRPSICAAMVASERGRPRPDSETGNEAPDTARSMRSKPWGGTAKTGIADRPQEKPDTENRTAKAGRLV